MRTEKQLLHSLTDFAKENQDIRLFALNGSRVNAKIPNDSLKDYDVVFFTDNVKKYIKNPSFFEGFGEVLLHTEPENGLFPKTFSPDEGYIYLVQYMDGTRIDFQFRMLSHLAAYLKEDSLTKILLDKDRRVKEPIIPDDSTHWVKKPSQKLFQASLAEFWWQNLNALKALAREELTLAYFYVTISREELLRLLTWKTALTHGFNRSYGKQNHQIIQLLGQEEQSALQATYCGLSISQQATALTNMEKVVEQIMPQLGKELNYSYPDFSQIVTIYLKAHGQTELLRKLEKT